MHVVYYALLSMQWFIKNVAVHWWSLHWENSFDFWATVCKMVCPVLSDHCLSCPVCLSSLSVLSVTLVYCGQTVGRMQMKLGLQVGLSPGHIVLDGDPAAPIFGPYLLWPNGWMDQDATWYGGRPPPKRHCVRWVPIYPLSKKGA